MFGSLVCWMIVATLKSRADQETTDQLLALHWRHELQRRRYAGIAVPARRTQQLQSCKSEFQHGWSACLNCPCPQAYSEFRVTMTKPSGLSQQWMPPKRTSPKHLETYPHGYNWPMQSLISKPQNGTTIHAVEVFGGKSTPSTMVTT